MRVIEKSYNWRGNLSKRSKTNYIVLHHAAASKLSADDVHRIHLSNGWSGIGYHFYVRKDGNIYRGRPIDTVGAQCSDYNSQSIGICFEGNFETETMSEAQLKSAKYIVNHAKSIYPGARVVRHKDLNATACPGKNFPFDKIISSDLTEVNDIVWELAERGIITNKELWLKKLAQDSDAYWLARKMCNMTVNKV